MTEKSVESVARGGVKIVADPFEAGACDAQHPALSKGGVAVITGGASGIGLAAARRFAAFGMKLVLADLARTRSTGPPRSYPTPSWSPYRPMSGRSMR